MEKIYSKVDGRLLHVIHRMHEFQGRQDVIPENNFLQCATLKMEKGKTFLPHKHITKDRHYPEQIAQESWVIIKGSVKCTFYDLDDSVLYETEIGKGDVIVLFRGGHSLEVLDKDTIFYEFKTGPYYGIEADKEAIDG